MVTDDEYYKLLVRVRRMETSIAELQRIVNDIRKSHPDCPKDNTGITSEDHITVRQP